MIISYLLIASIPLAGSFALYRSAENTVREQSNRYIKSALAQAQSATDSELQDVRMYALSLANKVSVRSLMDKTDSRLALTRYDAYELMLELSEHSGMPASIEETYIYFFRSDIVVSSAGVYEPRIITKYNEFFDGRDYSSVFSLKNEPHKRISGFFPQTGVSPPYLAQSFPISFSGEYKGIVMMPLIQPEIVSYLNEFTYICGGYAYLLDYEGTVMLRSAGAPEFSQALMTEGTEQIAIASGIEGWTYISVINRGDMMRDVNLMNSITITILIITLFISLIVIIVFSVMNYKPIRRLLDVFGGQRTELKVWDELKYVEREIVGLLDENALLVKREQQLAERHNELEGALFTQKELLSTTVLLRLLQNTQSTTAANIELLERFGIHIESGSFAVIAIQSAREDDSKRADIVAAVQSLAEAASIEVYSVECTENHTALILRSAHNKLDKALTEINCNIPPDNGIRIGVGSIAAHYADLHLSYKDALANIQTVHTKAGRSEKLKLRLREELTDTLRRIAQESDANAFVSARDDFDGFLADVAEYVASVDTGDGAAPDMKSSLADDISVYIETNFNNQALSATMIGEHFNRSPNYLSTYFKSQTGVSLTDFIATKRVHHAKHLLSNSYLTINEITTAVGYQNAVSFIRAFKRHTNMTPTQFRNISRKTFLRGPDNP